MIDENMLQNLRRILNNIMAQLRKIVYGDQGVSIIFINYIINKIKWK
jgi:hypothetical protein